MTYCSQLKILYRLEFWWEYLVLIYDVVSKLISISTMSSIVLFIISVLWSFLRFTEWFLLFVIKMMFLGSPCFLFVVYIDDIGCSGICLHINVFHCNASVSSAISLYRILLSSMWWCMLGDDAYPYMSVSSCLSKRSELYVLIWKYLIRLIFWSHG